MERIRGEAETRSNPGSIESHGHLSVGIDGSARPASNGDHEDMSSRFSGLGDRAADVAGRLRESIGRGIDRISNDIEDGDGVASLVRRYPVIATGAAFATGYLIATVLDDGDRNWLVERSRRRIKQAILAGVTGALAQELRGLVGAEDGLWNLVESFFDDDDGELYEVYEA
jgi:hypothetical protein